MGTQEIFLYRNLKLSTNLNGHMQSIDCEIPITHVLVGKRSYDWQCPPQEVLDRAQRDGNLLTPEEYIAVRQWKRAIAVEGKYSPKSLAWAESAEAAEEMKARFPEPEWEQSSLRVLPVENHA